MVGQVDAPRTLPPHRFTIQESRVLDGLTGCPATSQIWWYLPYALVGLIRLNCELFAGRSLYKQQVGSPRLGPRASGPPGLEALPYLSWAATPHSTSGREGITAPIIAAAPPRRQGDTCIPSWSRTQPCWHQQSPWPAAGCGPCRKRSTSPPPLGPPTWLSPSLPCGHGRSGR